MARPFRSVGGLNPGRSVFDLSYEKKFSCDMGQLIPVMCDEVVPGDKFIMANEIVIRFQPLVSPILHEINVYTHYFFVPYRLLWEDWEDFITGGIDGEFAEELPAWYPSSTEVKSLWDYFGFPIGVLPEGRYPMDFPKRAYNMVYAEYYRDQNLYPLEGDEYENFIYENENVLNRCWEKDYFTSALPWQQRGDIPALPVSGNVSAIWDHTIHSDVYVPESSYPNPIKVSKAYGAGTIPVFSEIEGLSNGWLNVPLTALTQSQDLNNNTVDLSKLATFDVAQMRLAFQVQKWLERNARAGVRYTEFLKAHFGVHPRDDRLQRPEYIGGSKSPIIISEVLQTSETANSPQGNMAGHGITADRTFVGKYSAQEFGLIIGIMSVMPRSAYQQGIDRQWLRQSKFDFFFPEFVHLSEQPIEQVELYATDDEEQNKTLFGYQGRYDEMRFKRNMVCGDMRESLNHWHLGRVFDQAPFLNQEFIECDPEQTKRIFAVENENGLIVNFGNIIKAIRPLPVMAEPGLIDHN